MNTILIGNLISFVGCSLMVIIGLIKEKKKILSVQCIQFSIQGIANLVLGGYTGFIANIVSIIRNLVFSRFKITTTLKMAFVALQLILSASSLIGGGFIHWLPIIAVVLYTWYLDLESEVLLKLVMIVCQICWLIYDIYMQNYVSTVFDIFTIISTTAGIYLILRSKRTQK